MNEPYVLAYNPFDGDRGNSGDRNLKDKMATARKAGPCHTCNQTIQPGERIRIRADVCDGKLMHWRWCQACCEAMAAVWTDNGEAIDARYALRRLIAP